YFNDENVDTQKFNKHITIKSYCHNDDCKTNEERINALTTHIFKEFKDSLSRKTKYNDYDEYFLLWLSDKLFKIHLESIGKKNVINYMDGTILNQAYEKYLKNHKVKFGYWDLFDMIKGLKEANLKYMAEFYKLLNLICKLITDYNNNPKNKKIYKYPADCSHQYKNLYLNISKCKSYLNLLNKLKGIYDDFSSVIKKNSSNSELATKLQTLTPPNGKEMAAVRGFKTYEISNTKCKFPKKKNTKPKKPDKSPLQPSNQLKGRQQETPPPHKPEIKETKQQSSTESAPQLPQVPASNVQKDSPGSQGISGGTSDQLPKHGVKSQNSDDGQHNPASNSGTPKNQTDIPSVQDKPQEANPTTPENTGKENAQRSDIADTSNKDHKLKVSDPISQDKQGHQPSEDKNPPIKSGSELKGDVKDIDKTPIDADTQDGSNPERKTKQDKRDTPKDTDTGTGNTKDNVNIGESGKEGSNGVTGNQNTHPESGSPSSGTGGPGSGTDGGPGSEKIYQGSSDGGTKDTTRVQSGVPDGQISNGSQGGENTSQKGTSGGSGRGTGNQGASSHQGGDTSSGSNGESPGTDTEKGGS
ncbi:CIR protein, partial [Plasmodium chabaudi adami]